MLPLIGSGSTGPGGQVILNLATGVIPKSDLGRTGSGAPGAFNAEIFAFDAAGQYNITQAVIPEGRTFRSTVMDGINPATGKPALLSGTAVRADTAGFDRGGLPLAKIREGATYRYSPITPLNSARGLRATLDYTYTRSTARQSEFELPTTEYGGVSLTGNQMEEKDRTVSTGLKVNGDGHPWTWANYQYVDYAYAGVHVSYYQWEPDHFQGSVVFSNPNCCQQHRHAPIGWVTYKQPKFNAGPGHNWAVIIGAQSRPWVRNTGNREENSHGISFTLGSLPGGLSGGHTGLGDLTTYGSVTSVAWTYTKGCPSGYRRVVWGNHTDPVYARRIMASCVRRKYV